MTNQEQQWPICRDCKFYYDPSSRTGECHRHAPSPLLFSHEDKEPLRTEVMWPLVHEQEWCGDFQKLEDEK
jgi:hypothetical protein